MEENSMQSIASQTLIDIQQLNLYYGSFHALKNVKMDIPEKAITAFIGPSGCGKSTLLRTLNRMNDMIPNTRIEGKILIGGADIYSKEVDVETLRKKVGMVFQQPNPFPKSIYDNVAYGPRLHGIRSKQKLDEIVETSLRSDRKSTRLNSSHMSISYAVFCLKKKTTTHSD